MAKLKHRYDYSPDLPDHRDHYFASVPQDGGLPSAVAWGGIPDRDGRWRATREETSLSVPTRDHLA